MRTESASCTPLSASARETVPAAVAAAENRSVANYVECLVIEALGEKRPERKNNETNHI